MTKLRQHGDYTGLSYADRKLIEEVDRVGFFNYNWENGRARKEETVQEQCDREGWND